jgi:hypothetical protein
VAPLCSLKHLRAFADNNRGGFFFFFGTSQAVLAVDTDPSSLFLETIPETLQRPEIRVAATSPASLLPIYPYLIQPMITESSMVVRGHGGGDSSCSSGVCELPLISPSSFMVDFRGNTVTWSAASDRAIWGVSCSALWSGIVYRVVGCSHALGFGYLFRLRLGVLRRRCNIQLSVANTCSR